MIKSHQQARYLMETRECLRQCYGSSIFAAANEQCAQRTLALKPGGKPGIMLNYRTALPSDVRKRSALPFSPATISGLRPEWGIAQHLNDANSPSFSRNLKVWARKLGPHRRSRRFPSAFGTFAAVRGGFARVRGGFARVRGGFTAKPPPF